MFKKYYLHMSILLLIINIFIILCYHRNVKNSVDAYMKQNIELLTLIKETNYKDLRKIDFYKKDYKSYEIKEYTDFLKSYYETQNNWLNYWLTIIGMILAFMAIVIPCIFAKRWDNEKKEFDTIKKELENKVDLAENKLNKLDINKINNKFNIIIGNKEQELKEMANSATDDLWKEIDDKKEELITSIKSTIIEDLLKNGPDTDYFLDKISDSLSDYINYAIEAKLEGDNDDRY